MLFCYWFFVCLGWGCCCLFVCCCFFVFFVVGFGVGFLGGWLLVFGWVVFCWFFGLVFFGWGEEGNYLGVVEASVVPPST